MFFLPQNVEKFKRQAETPRGGPFFGHFVLIHPLVRLGHQRLQLVALLAEGHAAGDDAADAVVRLIDLPQPRFPTGAELLRFLPAQVHSHHEKFVAPHPEGQNVAPLDALQALRGLADELVPGLVAEVVVEVFQVVHVHIEHGQGLLPAEQGILEGQELPLVVKPRQPVVLLLVLEGLGVVAHVPEQLHIVAAVHQMVQLQARFPFPDRGGHHHVALSAVPVQQVPAFPPLPLPGRGTGRLPVGLPPTDQPGPFVLKKHAALLVGDEDAAHVLHEKPEDELVSLHLSASLSRQRSIRMRRLAGPVPSEQGF